MPFFANLKKQEAFKPFEKDFEELLKKFRDANVDLETIEDTCPEFFIKLTLQMENNLNLADLEDLPNDQILLKKRQTIDQILLIFSFIYKYLRLDQHKTTAQQRAAIDLFSDDKINSFKIMLIFPGEGSEPTPDYTIDIRDLFNELKDCRLDYSSQGEGKEEKEIRERRIIKEIKNRLINNNKLHVDNEGNIYFCDEQHDVGSKSKLLPHTDIKKVSTGEGIDFEFFFRLLKLADELLTKTPSQFLDLQYVSEAIGPISKIQTEHRQKYSVIIKKLPKEYIKAEFKKLENLFDHPEKIANEVLEDKEIKSALADSSPSHLKDLIPQQHLFALMLYQERPDKDYIQVWGEEKTYPLQKIVEQFLESFSGHGNINPVFPVRLVEELGKPNPSKVILQISKLLIENDSQFQPQFILKFAKEHLPEKDFPQFLAKFYYKKLKADSIIQWLENLDIVTANTALELFAQQSLVDLGMIFNCSDRLMQTPIVKKYAREKFGLGLDVLLQHTEEKIPQVEQGEFKEVVQALLARTQSTETIKQALVLELTAYAQKNLRMEGNRYVAARLVPAVRARAYQQLAQLLAQPDLNLEEVETIYRNAEFRHNAGYHAPNQGALAARWNQPYTLWHKVERLREKFIAQENFFTRFTDDRLLVRVISDNACYNALSSSELNLIFNNCNRALFLELLVKYKRLDNWIPFLIRGPAGHGMSLLTADAIRKMARTEKEYLEKTNQLRLGFGIPQHIPAGYLRTGITENIAVLPNELLYQFQESDIGNAEHFLLTEYGALLANKLDVSFSAEAEQKDKPKRIAKNSQQQAANNPQQQAAAIAERKADGPSFYYIPSSVHPIIADLDKELERERTTGKRSKTLSNYYDFKRQLRALVNGHNYQRDGDVIFCGILLTGRNHYVPYFIRKSPANNIQITTVDPSPQSRKWTAGLMETSCGKQKANEILKRALLQDMFPECDAGQIDVNVTQQVRQRDCGPNALTVIEDALSRSKTDAPLITIEAGRMVLHGERLSVNLNHRRVYNHADGFYYYSSFSTEVARQNREKWAKRLRANENKEFQILLSETPLSAKTTFSALLIEGKRYDEKVDQQNHDDQMGELFNLVVAAMYGVDLSLDEIRAEFKTSLSIPSDQLVEQCFASIATDKPAILAQCKERKEDLRQIIREVIEKNLRDLYPEALINYADRFIEKYKLKNHEETVNDIFENYLQSPKVTPFVNKLGEKELEQVKAGFKIKLERAFAGKLLEFHKAILEEHLAKNVTALLKKLKGRLNVVLTEEDFHNFIIQHLNDPVIKASVGFFNSNFPDALNEQIRDSLKKLRANLAEKTLAVFQARLSSIETLEVLANISKVNPPSLYSEELLAAFPEQKDEINSEGKITRNLFECESKEDEHKPNMLAAYLSLDLDKSLNEGFTNKINQLVDSLISDLLYGSMKTMVMWQAPFDELESYLAKPENRKRYIDHLITRLPAISPESYVYRVAVQHIESLFIELVQQALRERFFQDAEKVFFEKSRLIDLDFNHLGNQLEKMTPDELDNNIGNIIIKLLERLQQRQAPENKDEKSLYEKDLEILKKLQPVQDGTPSLFFKRFAEVYRERFKQIILKKHTKIKTLKAENQKYSDFVALINVELASIVSERKQQDNDLIVAQIETISEILQGANRFAAIAYQLPEDQFEDIYTQTIEILRKEFKKFVDLISHYAKGKIYSNSLTARLRLLFCELLDIRASDGSDIPTYFTPYSATLLDKEIEKRLPLLLHPERPIFKTYEIKRPALVTPDAGNLIPNIYGKPLTHCLLAQIVMNWLKSIDNDNYDHRNKLPSTLRHLFVALQKLPEEALANPDMELSPEWCQRYIANIPGDKQVERELRKNKNADEIVFALLNCTNVTPSLPQRADAGAIVTFKQLEDIVSLYRNERQANALVRFNDRSYTLCPYSDPAKAEPGKFYVRVAEEKDQKKIEYYVVDPKGQIQKDEISAEVIAKMPMLQRILKGREQQQGQQGAAAVPASAFNIAALGPFLAQILNITQGRGHTYAQDNTPSLPAQVQAVTANQVTDEAKMAGFLGRNFADRFFASATVGIADFENALNFIRRRHALQGPNNNLVLDSADLEALKNILQKRWELLCDQSKAKLPENYRSFANPADRIYLMIALLVKAGLKNVYPDAKISAYDLLMPGRIKKPAAVAVVAAQQAQAGEEKKGDKPDGEDNLESIDDYNFKNVIMLPDGRWLHAPDFIGEYRQLERLQDHFSKKLLSKKDVAYILENYSDVNEELINIYKARNFSGFDDNVKKAFLKYLHGSVLAKGFSGPYNDRETENALAAWRELMSFLSKLPEAQCKLIMNAMVPGINKPLKDILNPKEDDCITYAGLNVAKLLWFETNVTYEELGKEFDSKRDQIVAIPRRSNDHPKIKMQENEGAILDFISRQDQAQLRR